MSLGVGLRALQVGIQGLDPLVCWWTSIPVERKVWECSFLRWVRMVSCKKTMDPNTSTAIAMSAVQPALARQARPQHSFDMTPKLLDLFYSARPGSTKLPHMQVIRPACRRHHPGLQQTAGPAHESIQNTYGRRAFL